MKENNSNFSLWIFSFTFDSLSTCFFTCFVDPTLNLPSLPLFHRSHLTQFIYKPIEDSFSSISASFSLVSTLSSQVTFNSTSIFPLPDSAKVSIFSPILSLFYQLCMTKQLGWHLFDKGCLQIFYNIHFGLLHKFYILLYYSQVKLFDVLIFFSLIVWWSKTLFGIFFICNEHILVLKLMKRFKILQVWVLD
jgi:hypothetical protein